MALAAAIVLVGFAAPALASNDSSANGQMLRTWYRLVLELVRHTPTYSPPVASRAFAYLGVLAYEAAASGDPKLASLAGQLNELKPLPLREAGQTYDEGVVLQAAIAFGAKNFFTHTGPTGQRALAAMERKMKADAAQGVAADVVARSEAYGQALGEHILAWSENDGGAVVENMGFPLEYKLTEGPAHWVPTNLIRVQQLPLLPAWGNNRTFATPNGKECGLPPPPAYSEDKDSAFYKEALEVHDVVNSLTPDQRAIARFWSDDPMLSPTPPGHWISIAMQILDTEKADAARSADILARLGITVADGFIGCWDAKYQYDLVRPVTYIKRVIDPKWETLLITPPFPEYPSGHSTQSGAAEVVLTAFFGDNFAFTDRTHEADGLTPRHYASFKAAAEEAGISRLYGGIHYRAAIVLGLEQGRCIGAYTVKLKTVN
jgi:hypothetical protein